MSTRVVVTGASGFLGTLLTRRLLSEPVALGGRAPADQVHQGQLGDARRRAGRRPGAVSGIIREPLAGARARCPVDPDTPVALSSPRRSVEGIVVAAAVDDATWGSRTALTLPALSTTPREMARALDRVAGKPASDLVDWDVDPAVERIVGTWPARLHTPRAERLGLRADASFDDVVRDYLTRDT